MIEKWNIEINEKIYKKLLIIGMIVMIAYVLITFLYFSVPRIYRMNPNTKIDMTGSVKNGVNLLKRGKATLEISAWAYREGQSVQTCKSCLILKSQETGRMYQLQTDIKEVPELQVVEGKYDCLQSGIYAKSIVLGLKDGNYDLLILYQNDQENVLVNTEVVVEI